MIIRSRILGFLFSLVCVLFYSCSQESEVKMPVSLGTSATVSLDTDLVVEDEELARAVYQVDGSSGRPLSHVLPEKNVLVRLAVRRGSSGTPLVQDELLLFQKVAGQNKYTFKGDLKIPEGSGTLQVAAFVVRESSGSSDDRVFLTESGGKLSTIETSRLLVADADGRVSIDNVVYMADWQSLTSTVVSGKTVYKLSGMRFKPSGTLLRLKFSADRGVGYKVPGALIKGKIKIETNAFFYDWSYSFPRLSSGNLIQGERQDVSQHTREFDIPEVAKDDKGVPKGALYLWVMPTRSTTSLRTSISTPSDGGYLVKYDERGPIVYTTELPPPYREGEPPAIGHKNFSLFSSSKAPGLGSVLMQLSYPTRTCYLPVYLNNPKANDCMIFFPF